MAQSPIDIFISYSRSDSTFVDATEQNFKSMGLTTWVDRREVFGGDRFMIEIRQAIAKSRIVFVILTPKSSISKYVMKEINIAKELDKQILPIMLLSCRPPKPIRDLNCIDFTRSYEIGWKHLLASLQRFGFTLSSLSVQPSNIPSLSKLTIRDRWINIPPLRKLIGGLIAAIVLISLIFKIVYPNGISSVRNIVSSEPSPSLSWIASTDGAIHSSPIITNGRVYVGSDDHNMYSFDAQSGSVKWSYSTGNRIVSSPVLFQKMLIVASSDDKLYALDALSGLVKWVFSTGGALLSSPVVINGIVYIGSGDNKLYALDAQSGSVKWAFSTSNKIASTPIIVNELVYVGSLDDKIYALDAISGAIRWSYTTGDGIVSSPVVANKTVYVGSLDNNIYALNSLTGSKVWSYATGEGIVSSPVVANGITYVNSGDGREYALDAANGSLKWSYSTGRSIVSSPTVAYGKVFVGSGDDKVYALDALSGSLKWSFLTNNEISSSPSVANGEVYVGSSDHKIYALDAANGSLQWSYPTGGSIESSPVISEAIVYIGSSDHRLYALKATQTSDIVDCNAPPSDVLTGTPLVIPDPSVSDSITFIGLGSGIEQVPATGELKPINSASVFSPNSTIYIIVAVNSNIPSSLIGKVVSVRWYSNCIGLSSALGSSCCDVITKGTNNGLARYIDFSLVIPIKGQYRAVVYLDNNPAYTVIFWIADPHSTG